MHGQIMDITCMNGWVRDLMINDEIHGYCRSTDLLELVHTIRDELLLYNRAANR
jgi:hypothetical protein